MPFLCPCLEMCYLRGKFSEQFADFTGRIYSGDTSAFYYVVVVYCVVIDNISAEDVNLFLLKLTYI